MITKLITLLFATDAALIVTIAFGVTTIRQAFPDWWRRHIADDEPEWRVQ